MDFLFSGLRTREPPALADASLRTSVLHGWSSRMWRGNRRVLVLLSITPALLFLYTWSLGERIHVVVEATPLGYVANVQGAVLTLRLPPPNGHVALYAGSIRDYVVGPIGTAPVPRPATPLVHLAQALRFASPQPAWKNIRATQPSRVVADLSPSLPRMRFSHWSWTRLGEIGAAPGFALPLARAPTNSFNFSADLVRGDGPQGVLVGLDGAGHGYVLVVQMDTDQTFWAAWNSHSRQPSRMLTGYNAIPVQPLPMVQRILRYLLPSVLVALVLVMAMLLVDALFPPLIARLTKPWDERRIDRLFSSIAGSGILDVAALLLAIVGILAAAFISLDVFRGIPNVQDGVAYLFQAKTLALGRFWVPAPRLQSFFSEDFVIAYHGHWFAKYSPGWPLLLTIGYLLGHANLVNPVLAGLNLALLYLIGREIYAKPVVFLATLLALSSPLFLFVAGTFLSHTATLFYLSAFLYLIARWERRRNTEEGSWHGPGRRDRLLLVPAGFFLGMGMMTRQLDAVAFAIPFVLLLVRRPLRLVLLAIGAAGPTIAALLYNKALTGNLFANAYTLAHSFDRVGFGPHIGKEGFTPGQGLWNISHDLELLQAHLFGWPYYVALAFALIPFVLGRARRWDVILAASALCVVTSYAFYFDPGDWYGLPRYYYVTILPLALLTARGVEELCCLGRRLPFSLPSRSLSRLAGPVLLLPGLLFYNLTLYIPAQTATFSRWNSANLDALNSVRSAHLHDALVFQVQTPWSYWWPYAQVFSQNSALLNGDIVYARDEGCADRRLMSLYPHRAYYRLNNTTLQRISPSCASTSRLEVSAKRSTIRRRTRTAIG